MKKIIFLLMAVCMAAGLACAGAFNVHAADADIAIAAIEAFNASYQSHGGIGSLVATVTGTNEVTVTGSVTCENYEDDLWIETGETAPYLTVRWNAVMGPRSVLYVNGYGTFEVIGGKIGGRLESRCWDAKVIVSGGEVNCFIITDIKIQGGLVQGHNIVGERLAILKGATVKLADSVLGVSGEETCCIQSLIVYIDPEADVELDVPLTKYIKANQDFSALTAVGNVAANWNITIKNGQILTVPSDATLALHNPFTLDGGTLVLDGPMEIMKEYNGELVVLSGTITGKSAGSLAGTYKDGKKVTNIIIVDPPLNWWQRLPHFLQWIMRWLCFGWLWMK